jgi:hypothetical protein
MTMPEEFCFCTLAVGKRYRKHALVLAKDIRKQAPDTSFLVLTDCPSAFAEYSQVIPIKHQLQSVQGYHDKRFVIEKALLSFDTCMYLDADVRIMSAVPTNMEWLPGITARAGCSILKHNSRGKVSQALPIIEQVAQKLEIDLEETKWFHEFMFTVKKQSGAEIEFLKLWQTISYIFELQNIYDGEGNVMGLAAAKTELTIRLDSEDRFLFFKDNIEKERIKHGKSNLENNQALFEAHKEIEYPSRSIWQKAFNKLVKKTIFLYRLLRLRYFAKKDSALQRLL